MAKCFIFAIGGSGSRVLKSLTFLLGAGCFYDKLKKWDFVPIIVDIDMQNYQLDNTNELLKWYSSLSESVAGDGGRCPFFKYRIRKIFENGFQMPIQDEQKSNLADTIDYLLLDPLSKQLVDLLYRTTQNGDSQKDHLFMDLAVGVKGAPNIGSVILNQIPQSQSFKDFANKFEIGDCIFIIGSLFGGTGASGIPIIAKTIRAAAQIEEIDNANLLVEAPMGALLVLPYYGVKQDKTSAINSDTFIGKTKAALRYYQHQNEFNSLYYVAENPRRIYENSEGGKKQNNYPHYIELIGAKSLFHFLTAKEQEESISQNSTSQKNRITRGYEYGLERYKVNEAFNLRNFAPGFKDDFVLPLIKYYYVYLFLTKELKKLEDLAFYKKNKLNEDFSNSNFGARITQFSNEFHNWLGEMAENDPSFRPFRFNVNSEKLKDAIYGYPISVDKGFLKFKSAPTFDTFANFCNEAKIEGTDSDSAKLLEILYYGSEAFLKKYKTYFD